MFHEIEKVSDFAKENNMFRKTLTALALMGVASHGVASTLGQVGGQGEVVLTPQAAASLAFVGANDFTLTTAAASIAGGSVLNLTFSKAPTNPNSVSATAAGGAILSYSGATNDGLTLNYTLSAAIAVGEVITISGTEFAIASVSSSPITVDAAFTNVGTGIDPAAAKLELVTETATNQFGVSFAAATDLADAVVSVDLDRYAFVAPATNDVISFSLTNTDAATEAAALGAQQGTVQGATLTGVTWVLGGDFSWAENIDEDPAVAGFQLAAGTIACAQAGVAVTEGAGDDAPTATAYTFSTTTGAQVDCTLTPQTAAGSDEIVLPTGEFTISATAASTDLNGTAVAGAAALAAGTAAAAGTQAIAAVDAGEWTIDGAQVTVFAVPFGAEVESHSIFVSNTGASTGAITASLSWNGNDAVLFSLGNVEPGANKYLNIIDALTDAGELPPFGRANITFTVNAPAAEIAVTAGYNTAEGRTNLYVQDQVSIVRGL